MSNPPSTPLEVPDPKFDQIVKGNVTIKKLSKYKYTNYHHKIVSLIISFLKFYLCVILRLLLDNLFFSWSNNFFNFFLI